MYFIKLFLHSEKIKKAIYNNDSFLSTAPHKKENKVLLKQGFIFYGAGAEAEDEQVFIYYFNKDNCLLINFLTVECVLVSISL